MLLQDQNSFLSNVVQVPDPCHMRLLHVNVYRIYIDSVSDSRL